LLPLVYDALRRLAAEKMAQESPGQTLQATALVHEVYRRLVDTEQAEECPAMGEPRTLLSRGGGFLSNRLSRSSSPNMPARRSRFSLRGN
jgi:hypothetical protein